MGRFWKKRSWLLVLGMGAIACERNADPSGRVGSAGASGGTPSGGASGGSTTNGGGGSAGSRGGEAAGGTAGGGGASAAGMSGATGTGGGALVAPVFDGETAYVEVPDADVFSEPTTGEFSVEAWIRPDSLDMPNRESSGYVHWMGKGVSGEHEWVARMYQQGNSEDRANRIR